MGWSTTQRFGLTHHRPQRSFKGYTLVVPSGGGSAYLVDMDGRFVHRWSFDGFVPAKSELLENGNLLVMGVDRGAAPGGSSARGGLAAGALRASCTSTGGERLETGRGDVGRRARLGIREHRDSP